MTSHRIVRLQLLEDGDEAGQDLGHSAPHGGGVHHLDGMPSQRARQRPQFIHLGLANDG